MIIGLTGSSGSGKSTVAEMFRQSGCHIVDCDKISREIDRLPEYKAEIMNLFGNEVFDKDGNIARRKLSKIAFSDKENLIAISKISHPLIKKQVYSEIEEYKKSMNVVIDAPLLFESGLDRDCDITVGVIAENGTRISRIIERDHVDELNASRRALSQKNNDFYKENCILIIENNGTRNELEKEFIRIAGKIGLEIK